MFAKLLQGREQICLHSRVIKLESLFLPRGIPEGQSNYLPPGERAHLILDQGNKDGIFLWGKLVSSSLVRLDIFPSVTKNSMYIVFTWILSLLPPWNLVRGWGGVGGKQTGTEEPVQVRISCCLQCHE